MSLNDLKPSNSLKARESSVKTFKRFLEDEGIALSVVDDALRAKDGSALKKNTVGQYFRQTKMWILERFPHFTQLVDGAILAKGRILERYSAMRPGSKIVKQAAACTKQDLYSLLNYIYTTATVAVDYQDAALLAMLWYLFGRASDLAMVDKQSLSLSGGNVLFVRFLRMKTAEEQGLTQVTTCPLTALAIALALQSAPSSQLLPHLPQPTPTDLAVHGPLVPLAAVLHGCTRDRSLLDEAAEAVAGTGGDPHQETASSKTKTALPGIHAYVNRVLSRISVGARITTALTSHSFRRGGAQHVNGHPGISPQWIADRGGWNMTTTNKVFAYIFNTTNEDQKVAKILSGHDVDARVKVVDLSGFDATTRANITSLQHDLFSCCVGLQDKALNVSPEVIDVMFAYLLKAYPHRRSINPASPFVARVENAMKRVGIQLEQLLSWSIRLGDTARKPSAAVDTPNTKHLQMIEHQAAVINQLIDVTRAQAERLREIEAKLGVEQQEAEPEITLKRSRGEPTAVDTPKRRKRKSTNMWETWYEWFACRAFSTQSDRQWRSTMRRCVAYMKLFVDSLVLDADDDSFRDQVLAAGKQAAAKAQVFLVRHAITCTSTGAVEKKFRELHRTGMLNQLIADYDARVQAGLITDPTPLSHQPERLRPNEICSLKEFITYARQAIRKINTPTRKFFLEDEPARKLRASMILTVASKEHLPEAIRAIMTAITDKIETVKTTTRIRKSHVKDWLVDDDEVEWVADQSLEERPLYGVNRILDRKRVNGVTYYLVDWEPTWETRNDVGSTLIATFEKERRALVRRTFIEDEAVEAGK
ncbi:hypothetical protein ATCC90586_011824 [Pythium insidiosum]|nr:hypothetical protein ATCC90586_011824 [Pythium insidiosum]